MAMAKLLAKILAQAKLITPKSVTNPLAKILVKVKSMSPKLVVKPLAEMLAKVKLMVTALASNEGEAGVDGEPLG